MAEHPRPDLLGMGVALILGLFAATAFTLVVVPVIYYMLTPSATESLAEGQ
jgi:hypothetical protein